MVFNRLYQRLWSYAAFLKALKDWLPSVNGKFFARDLATIEKESTLGYLTVIIEFTSKEDAVTAYVSEEY